MGGKKFSTKDKIDILDVILLPQITQRLEDAFVCLEQAKDDWVKMNSIDGDRKSVKQPPILSVVEGQGKIEMAQKILAEIKRLVGDE